MNDTPRVSVAWQVSTDPRMGAIGNWIPQPAGQLPRSKGIVNPHSAVPARGRTQRP